MREDNYVAYSKIRTEFGLYANEWTNLPMDATMVMNYDYVQGFELGTLTVMQSEYVATYT